MKAGEYYIISIIFILKSSNYRIGITPWSTSILFVKILIYICPEGYSKSRCLIIKIAYGRWDRNISIIIKFHSSTPMSILILTRCNCAMNRTIVSSDFFCG